MNGIIRIKLLVFEGISRRDILGALLSDLGCSVSSMPKNYQSKSYSDNWEMMNPEEVQNPKDLPDYWKMVYDLHNEPDRRDCVRFRYRYVHCPENILSSYPRVFCKGMFILSDENVDIDKLKETDLIHIGNEFNDGGVGGIN